MRAIISGIEAGQVTMARLDSDLRRSPYATTYGTDPRLVDPRLEAEFSATAQRVRAQAQAEGYAAGYAEGEKAGMAAAASGLEAQRVAQETVLNEQAARTDQALARLAAAASALEARLAPSAEEVEQQVAQIAFSLLETLLQRELSLTAQPGMDAVRRALALTPRDRPVVARLNPADVAALPKHAATIDGREVSVVADPTVELGGCIADCDATRVDAQLSTALERVRQVLQS